MHKEALTQFTFVLSTSQLRDSLTVAYLCIASRIDFLYQVIVP